MNQGRFMIFIGLLCGLLGVKCDQDAQIAFDAVDEEGDSSLLYIILQ